MRLSADVGLLPDTRYRINVFDKVVLQVKINGLTEEYWRDANKTDLCVTTSPPNKFRVSWLGKIILQVPLPKTEIRSSKNGEEVHVVTIDHIDAEYFNLNIEDRPK